MIRQQLARATFSLLYGIKYGKDWCQYHYREKINRRYVSTDKNYTRFLVISAPRCGSTMLARGLMYHPRAVCFGEVFRKPKLKWDSFSAPGYFMPRSARQLYEESPADFIETYLYGDQPEAIQAVGCKIHYGQGRPEVWKYFQDHREVKIIHLIRQNLLAELLSKMRARESGVFVQRTDGIKGRVFNLVNRSMHPVRDALRPLYIDPAEAEAFFRQREEQRRSINQEFSEHEMIRVYFESLKEPRTWETICRFLDLPQQSMQAVTAKQRRKSLNQSIANYEELKKYFLGSEWQSFFESE